MGKTQIRLKKPKCQTKIGTYIGGGKIRERYLIEQTAREEASNRNVKVIDRDLSNKPDGSRLELYTR